LNPRKEIKVGREKEKEEKEGTEKQGKIRLPRL
jgi:hypothetical protein